MTNTPGALNVQRRLASHYLGKLQAVNRAYQQSLSLGTTTCFEPDWAQIPHSHNAVTAQAQENPFLAAFIADMHESCEDLHAMRQNPHERLASYQAALAAARLTKNTSAEVFHLNAISKVYLWLSDYQQAGFHAQQAATLAEQIGDTLTRIAAMHTMGTVYLLQRGNGEVTRAYFSQGLELALQCDDPGLIGVSLMRTGSISAVLGDFTASEQYYRDALALCEERGDKAGEASVSTRLSLLHHQRGEYHNAVDYGLRSFNLRKRIADNMGMASSLAQLCTTYLKCGNLDAAYDALIEGLLLVQNGAALVTTRLSLLLAAAQLYIVRGDYEDAGLWLGMVEGHPQTSESGLMFQAHAVRSELENVIGEARLQTCIARSNELDLDVVMRHISFELCDA